MKYEYWLDLLPLSVKEKILLTGAFKGAEGVFNASTAELKKSNLLSDEKCEYISREKNKDRLSANYEALKARGINFITVHDEGYPERFKTLKGMPYGIYIKGNLKNDIPCFGIVGARRCSAYGRKMTSEIVNGLSGMGIGIVSGMARGIDGEAHSAALKNGGYTIAVLGSGVDVCYPKEHEGMYREILSSGGCIISENPPGTEPLAKYFPGRNRIISALSDGICVMEAAKKSGSLITADYALEQGRSVFALPGRCGDVLSYGTNHLIEQGAGIIVTKEDFFREISEFFPKVGLPLPEAPEIFKLEKEEMLVYSCLDFYGTGADDICEKTHLPLISVLQAIISLTEKGFCKECFLNQYVKLR